MLEIFTAYMSGILASFTPCMVALYPLLFFRLSKEKKVKKTLFLLSLGFLLVFAMVALFLSQLDFEKIRFGFGLVLVFLGLAGIFKILPNLSTNINTLNPFIFGITMALVFSTNPCSLPFLLTILSGSMALNLNILSSLLFFSLGLLTPIIVFALIGNAAITHILMKHASKVHYIEKFLNLLLIITGIYLIFSIHSLNEWALWLSSALILGTFIGVAWLLFPDVRKEPFIIFIFLSLLFILSAFVFHCKEYVSQTPTLENTCSYNPNQCESCTICGYLFLIATFSAALALYLRYYRKCSSLKTIKFKVKW